MTLFFFLFVCLFVLEFDQLLLKFIRKSKGSQIAKILNSKKVLLGCRAREATSCKAVAV